MKNVTLSYLNESNYNLSWSHPSLCPLIFRISYWTRGRNDRQVGSVFHSMKSLKNAVFNYYKYFLGHCIAIVHRAQVIIRLKSVNATLRLTYLAKQQPLTILSTYRLPAPQIQL